MKKETKCQWCGVFILSPTRWKYCSDECSKKAYNAKLCKNYIGNKKLCKFCKIEIKEKGIFVCRKCADERSKERLIKYNKKVMERKKFATKIFIEDILNPNLTREMLDSID